MKPLFTFGVCGICVLALALPAAAQHGGRTSALGGTLAPQGALSHPLGGFTGRGPIGAGAGANRGFRGNRFGNGRGLYGYPWGYSYYIPGYFDYLDTDTYPGYNSSFAAPSAPAYPVTPAAPAQPVIINQYFGSQGPEPQQQENAPAPAENTQPSAAANSTPQNYYLIAYKNHAVYSALAYWVEDKTLHYVTTQNTHNQASLDLIDLNLTKTLNQSNDVPFTIPGQ